MGQQYGRAMTLTLGGQTIAQLADNPDDCVRVRFKVVSLVTQTPNHAQIILTNLSAQTAQSYVAMVKQNAELVLTAGYGDNSGTIFIGDSWYAIDGRETQTETTLQLFARDKGLAYDYGYVNKSLQKGSTPQDHFNTFVEALSQYGVTAGYTPDLSQPQYPRGVAFSGMVKDHMRVLAASHDCTWSIQQGQLQMVPTSGSVPGSPTPINAATGLIGMPTQTVDGIMVRCLINPALNCGSGNLIQLNNADIQKAALSPSYGADAANQAVMSNIAADGIYRILHIEVTGDTRGNDWYQDLTCYNASNLPANVSQQYLPAANGLTARN